MRIEKKDDGYVYAFANDNTAIWAKSIPQQGITYHFHPEKRGECATGIWRSVYDNQCLKCKEKIPEMVLNFFDLYSLE